MTVNGVTIQGERMKQLYLAIVHMTSEHGGVVGLHALSVELEQTYCDAWQRLAKLERRGLVHVHRSGPGARMLIRSAS